MITSDISVKIFTILETFLTGCNVVGIENADQRKSSHDPSVAAVYSKVMVTVRLNALASGVALSYSGS